MKGMLRSLLYGLLVTVSILPAAWGQKVGSAFEKEIWQYANAFRKSKGKPPLSYDPTIANVARDHSCAMSKGKVGFGHEGFERRTTKIKKQTGAFSAAAENVAYGNIGAKEVMNNWIKSPPHRKNLLGNYNTTGIGTCMGKNGRIYFTQIFTRNQNKKTTGSASP